MPESLREWTVELAHEGHQGIVKTKAMLQMKVRWPGMDRAAEEACRACHEYQLVSQPDGPEPVSPTKLPAAPWVDLEADLMGPIPSGEYLFVVVDYYSRFIKVKIMRSIQSEKVVAVLDEMFARYGLPKSLRTDNGPQLIAAEFMDYLEERNIKHRRITPFWPQANGEVERQNRHLLKAMMIAKAGGRSLQELSKYLMAYRTTPHSTTGVSPAELLYGQKIRTKVPQLSEINQSINQ